MLAGLSFGLFLHLTVCNSVSGGSSEIPIDVKPQISFSESGGRVHITVNPRSMARQTIGDVVIVIPFSKLISSTNLTATWGDVHYDEMEKVIQLHD